ncbi:unnamed protein product [Protopolystoma xenopodis]|uniref:Uncharacterized protein n=1 Tax=Protopolystoma xenopodis TaxID=117903 RepID=A0A3S5ACL0_9PLAT|nr:unnamed protein product [Protopolystoma xenopodis]
MIRSRESAGSVGEKHTFQPQSADTFHTVVAAMLFSPQSPAYPTKSACSACSSPCFHHDKTHWRPAIRNYIYLCVCVCLYVKVSGYTFSQSVVRG